MTKHLKHLVAAIFGLLAVISLAVQPQQNTQAASTKTVDIVLHKLLFDKTLPDEQQNDGQTQPDFGQSSKPLNGVTFTAYDVTDAYWQLVADGKGMEAAQATLAADSYQPTDKIESLVTAGEGVAAFNNLPLRKGNHYAVYLFKETGTPEGIEGQSQNLVVVLPGNNSDGLQSRIDLFPKNKLVDGNTDVDKSITDNHNDFDYGEAIPYQIKVTVPANIGALKSFRLTDTADKRLKRISDITVKVDGKNAKGMYKVVKATDNYFELDFDTEALTPYANKKIVVTYQMQIKPDTEPDEPLINQTVLYPGDDDPLTDQEVVMTAGKHFEKVDAKKTDTKLAGATFVVMNSKNQYLVKNTDGWKWQTVNGDVVETYQQEKLHTLVSDNQGRFAIAGLKAGKYRLLEVKAPAGYQRNSKAIPFSVVLGEYSDKQAIPYAVVNVANPQTPEEPNVPSKPGKPNEPSQPDKPATVTPSKPNKPGKPDKPTILGRLPQTGEERGIWLSVLGLILIAIVVLIKVRTKKQTNH